MIQRYLYKIALLVALLSIAVLAHATQTTTVTLNDGTELDVVKYDAPGDRLLIVFPSEHGLTKGLHELASGLQASGITTWLVDPFTTWLLPPLSSSLGEIPVGAYASLLLQAENTEKDIFLMSNGKGSVLTLQAAHQWQQSSTKQLAGVILVSPNLYAQTPAAGNEADLLPIAHSTNVPAFIFIPEKSTLALRINDTVKALQNSGSDVFTRVLENVRDRFFFREDATQTEQELAASFSKQVKQAMSLTKSFKKKRNAVAVKEVKKQGGKSSGKIVKYTGALQPEDFSLRDLSGVEHRLSQYRGKVVLINFWASWCPPCVHEMPSMTALNKRYSNEEFEILAINLGEEEKDIKAFLKLRPVNFPVLLDPQKSLPTKWKVFAFPTSYLLDRSGNIRYSVAGGIDWLEEDVGVAIRGLLDEL